MIDKLNVKFNIPFLIPEQYNDAMSYQELLYAVIDKLNTVINSVNSVPDEIVAEVNKQVNQLIESGFFDTKISALVDEHVADLTNKIDKNANDIANEWQKIYPVGSYYFSESATSPAVLFGGTWDELNDKFIVASGSTFAKGADGGALNHTHANQTTQSGGGGTSGSTILTIAQLPPHEHRTKVFRAGTKTGDGPLLTKWIEQSSSAEIIAGTEPVGGGTGHTHTIPSHTHALKDTAPASSMPPYHPVHVWCRTK